MTSSFAYFFGLFPFKVYIAQSFHCKKGWFITLMLLIYWLCSSTHILLMSRITQLWYHLSLFLLLLYLCFPGFTYYKEILSNFSFFSCKISTLISMFCVLRVQGVIIPATNHSSSLCTTRTAVDHRNWCTRITQMRSTVVV